MLNQAVEAKFAALRDKCRELHVPCPPEIFIGLKVHDKNGVLIFDDVQRGHSWTRNYYNGIFLSMVGGTYTALFGVGYLSHKNIAGTVENGLRGATTIGALGGAYGLVIGTGNTAFSPQQFTLAALINPGTGSGQMSYAAESAITSAYTALTKIHKATRVRIFNNNSGGSITVREAGLKTYSGGYNNQLVERSVLSPEVPVPNGAQLTVTYEISMDFSAID